MLKLEPLSQHKREHYTTEPSKRSLNGTLKSSRTERGYQSQVSRFNYETETLLEQIRRLSEQNKLYQKEIERLTHINEYLIKANQAKLNILKDERESTISKPIIRTPQQQTMNNEMKKTTLGKLVDDTPMNATQVRRKTYRNPTLSRLHIETENELMKSEKNLMLPKTSSFYDVLQLEDCFKTNAILNLLLTDDDCIQQYHNDGTISLMKELLDSEESFSEIIQSISAQKLSFVFDKLKRIMSDHSQLFILVLRLKRIVVGALQMSSSVLLDDALTAIIDRCTDCLECDRASCFIVDQTKKELWTKVAKGANSTIRLQLGQGFAGHVASTHHILNIENAYLDQRFNAAQDAKTNYKTKTVLVSPILDGDKCIAVLQCVNKQSGFFNKDDEAILSILGDFSKTVLKNALNHDAQLLVQNKLRHLIKTGIMMYGKLDTMQGLLFQAEERLRSMMNVDHAKVVFTNGANLFHLDKESAIVEVDPQCGGLMGLCLKTQSLVAVGNSYTHPQFNPVIDIETHMPLICMPIKGSNTLLGAIQVVNVKGIGNLQNTADSKVNPIDFEMLDLFCQVCAQCFHSFITYH